MQQLYTIHFTTQTRIKKYDSKGKMVAETQLDKPVTITALPYATAMSYGKCDNFAIEPYVMEQRRSSKGSGRDTSVGNGTKKVVYSTSTGVKAGPLKATASGTGGRSKINEAAATGNLAAAINA